MAHVNDDEHVQLIDEKDMNFRKTLAVIDLLGRKKDKMSYWAELNDRKSGVEKMRFLREDKNNFIDKPIFEKLKLKTEGLDSNAPFTTENLLNVLRPEVSVELHEYDPQNYKRAEKINADFQLSSMKDFDIENYEDTKSTSEEGAQINQRLFRQLHEDIVFMQNAKEQVADSTFIQALFDNKESCTHLIDVLSHLTK